MKIRPVRAELFHAGGRMDGDDEAVAFRNFANAPKKSIFVVVNRLLSFSTYLVPIFWQRSGILRERSAAFRSQLAGKFGTQ